MRKTVLFLTIAGCVIGIFSNIIFYTFSSVGAIIISAVFKGMIPALDLSAADATLQQIIFVNTIIASLLCIVSAIAGIIYFISEKNDGIKKTGKYISTIILLSASAGMVVTYSIYCLILPGLAAIIASISVINDLRTGNLPGHDGTFISIIITILCSGAVLAAIYFLPEKLI